MRSTLTGPADTTAPTDLLRRDVTDAATAFELAGAPAYATPGYVPRDLDHPERWTDEQCELLGAYHTAVAALAAALDPEVDAVELGQVTALLRKFKIGKSVTEDELRILRRALDAAENAFGRADADADYYATADDPEVVATHARLRLAAARDYRDAATALSAVLADDTSEALACLSTRMRLSQIVANSERELG